MIFYNKPFAISHRHNGGFTILEILIVIGIVAILSVSGLGYYRNALKSIELDSAAKAIIETLRDARSRASLGQGGYKWGVVFINSSTTNTYYYELFSTPTDYSSVSKTID